MLLGFFTWNDNSISGLMKLIISSSFSNTVDPLYSHTPSGLKKNGVIIKILYGVTKEGDFLISLLVTWANVNVLIKGDVTISGVTIEGVDCTVKTVLKYCVIKCYCGFQNFWLLHINYLIKKIMITGRLQDDYRTKCSEIVR